MMKVVGSDDLALEISTCSNWWKNAEVSLDDQMA